MEEEAERTKKWAMPPGESLIDENHAPFLAYNEEYFRHITVEDVAAFVPEGRLSLRTTLTFAYPRWGGTTVLGESAASPQSRSPFRSLFPTGSVSHLPSSTFEVPSLSDPIASVSVAQNEDEDAQEAERRRLYEEELRRNLPRRVRRSQSRRRATRKATRPDDKLQVQVVSPMENPDEKAECCHVCWDGSRTKITPFFSEDVRRCGAQGVLRHRADTHRRLELQGRVKKKNPSKRAPQGAACARRRWGAETHGNGKWCHLFCSQWMPETFIDDIKTMEPAMGIGDIDKERSALTCSVCKKRGCGPVSSAFSVTAPSRTIPYARLTPAITRCRLRRGSGRRVASI